MHRNMEIVDLMDKKMYELQKEKEQNQCLERRASELAQAVEEWQRKDYAK